MTGISPPPDGQKRQGWFSNVIELEDESLVVVGQIIDTYEDSTRNPNLWLLKLDKDGCFFPDCGEDQLLITATNDFIQSTLFVKLFPNPANEHLNLEFTGNVNVENISIMDVVGNKVQNNFVSGSISEFKLDTSLLAPGIYILIVQLDQGKIVRKFVKN